MKLIFICYGIVLFSDRDISNDLYFWSTFLLFPYTDLKNYKTISHYTNIKKTYQYIFYL